MTWHDHDAALRATIEDLVRQWHGASQKPMFGHPCFLAEQKLFAMIDGNAVVLMRLSAKSKAELTREWGAAPYMMPGGPVGEWLRIPVENRSRTWELASYIREAFDAALKAAE